LKINDFSFAYPNKTKALTNISLNVGKGDFLGIIGLNGSGKSTLALNIIGILKGNGKIVLEGKDISKKGSVEEWAMLGRALKHLHPNGDLAGKFFFKCPDDLQLDLVMGHVRVHFSHIDHARRADILQQLRLRQFAPRGNMKNGPFLLFLWLTAGEDNTIN